MNIRAQFKTCFRRTGLGWQAQRFGLKAVNALGFICVLMAATMANAQEINDDPDSYQVDDPVISLLTGKVTPTGIAATPPMPTGAIEGGIHVTWSSANSSHKRLYFEEKLLERHGIHDGELRTNVRSARRFFTRAIGWPMTMRIFRPEDRQSPYSMRRPGSPKTR